MLDLRAKPYLMPSRASSSVQRVTPTRCRCRPPRQLHRHRKALRCLQGPPRCRLGPSPLAWAVAPPPRTTAPTCTVRHIRRLLRRAPTSSTRTSGRDARRLPRTLARTNRSTNRRDLASPPPAARHCPRTMGLVSTFRAPCCNISFSRFQLYDLPVSMF